MQWRSFQMCTIPIFEMPQQLARWIRLFLFNKADIYSKSVDSEKNMSHQCKTLFNTIFVTPSLCSPKCTTFLVTKQNSSWGEKHNSLKLHVNDNNIYLYPLLILSVHARVYENIIIMPNKKVCGYREFGNDTFMRFILPSLVLVQDKFV